MDMAMLKRPWPIFWRMRVIEPLKPAPLVDRIIFGVMPPLARQIAAKELPQKMLTTLGQPSVSFKQPQAGDLRRTLCWR